MNNSTKKLSGLITATLAGKVFTVCWEEGVNDREQISAYEQEILQKLENTCHQGASMADIERTMGIELEALRMKLRGESNDSQDDWDILRNANAADDESTPEIVEESQPEPKAARKPPAKPKKSSGYKPESVDMHKKLEIQRKPVADLVATECVQMGLLDRKRADYWVHNMPGRVKEEVEADIVDELARNLHDKVKKYIRKNKGDNPWSTPQLQNDLRTDIMSVKTVKGMLLLSTSISLEVSRHEEGKKPGVFKRLWKKSGL